MSEEIKHDQLGTRLICSLCTADCDYMEQSGAFSKWICRNGHRLTKFDDKYYYKQRIASLEAERERVKLIKEALDEYHYALDLRHHGDVAAHHFVNKVELILDCRWRQRS